MSRTRHVEINQAVISQGKSRTAFCCPVSIGLTKAILWECAVSPNLPASTWGFRIYDNNRHLYTQKFLLPQDVADRINEYDRTGIMEPFEFDVEIPIKIQWFRNGHIYIEPE
jgi:hypothetical protein